MPNDDRMRHAWLRFFVIAAGLATFTFASFSMVEWLWFRDASASALLTLHFSRGVGTSGVAVAYATIHFRRHLYALESQDAKWLTFLDGLPVAVFALDSQGRPAFANRPALELLGRGVMPDADPGNLSTVYPSFVAGTDQVYPPENMPIVKALTEKESSIVDDVELQTPKGRVPIEAWASPILDKRGEVAFAIAVFFDISGRRELEAIRVDRIRSEEKARHAQEAMVRHREFINHAAHQLFTPLTPLMLNVSLLRDKAPAKTVEALSRSVDRMQEIVSEILRVAKMERHLGTLQLTGMQMSSLLDAAIAPWASAALEKGISIDQKCQDGEIVCDDEKINDALSNVIHNAIKNSPEGGQIRIEGRVGGVAQISVSDDGPGWRPENLEHLFDPFWQGENTRDASGQGWGLGLYVSRALVEDHGGRIEATSPGPGLGAKVTIHLPQKQGPHPDVNGAGG